MDIDDELEQIMAAASRTTDPGTTRVPMFSKETGPDGQSLIVVRVNEISYGQWLMYVTGLLVGLMIASRGARG